MDLIGGVRGNFVAPLLLLFRFAGSMIIGVVFSMFWSQSRLGLVGSKVVLNLVDSYYQLFVGSRSK